jgi:hypothetical protein
MPKNLASLAVLDHDCRGFDGCQVCTQAFFARSNAKWSRFQDKMRQIREKAGQIDLQVVAAVMSPGEEE